MSAPNTPAALAAAVVAVTPAAPHHNAFTSILQHVGHFFEIGLKDVIVYTPAVGTLASLLFPEVAGASAVAVPVIEGVATTIQNTVLAVQQKYAQAPAGSETNAAKLADALAIAGPAAKSALAIAGVPVDDTRLTNTINAVVALLKLQQVPAGLPAPTPAQ